MSIDNFEPVYLRNFSKLKDIEKILLHKLEACNLCPRNCGVNRLKGEVGFCKTASKAILASYGPHFGEERCLVGRYGSGTIFFSQCNLKCIFCQNHDISIEGYGRIAEPEDIAKCMIELQKKGCHNINLVTPTHVVPQIVSAVIIAIDKGLNLPLVYNCGGYESVETLRILKNVFDIYMPDIKFFSKDISSKLCNAADYSEVVKQAVKEMHSHVGDLVIVDGVAIRGLLIRHLVLPNRLANSFEIIDFLAQFISKNTAINVMNQYYPCWNAYKMKELSRTITEEEFIEVLKYAQKKGLRIIH